MIERDGCAPTRRSRRRPDMPRAGLPVWCLTRSARARPLGFTVNVVAARAPSGAYARDVVSLQGTTRCT